MLPELPPRLLYVTHSALPQKRKKAVFMVAGGHLAVHFGSVARRDYTTGASDKERELYITQCLADEEQMEQTSHWTDPLAPATLSRYLLWERRSLAEALKIYRRLFKV